MKVIGGFVQKEKKENCENSTLFRINHDDIFSSNAQINVFSCIPLLIDHATLEMGDHFKLSQQSLIYKRLYITFLILVMNMLNLNIELVLA